MKFLKHIHVKNTHFAQTSHLISEEFMQNDFRE